MPEAVLDEAFERVHGLLRPSGMLVVGTMQGDVGSLDAAVDDLRTVRSGGSVVTAEDAASRLQRAGFREVREAELGMEIPLGLVVGSRAAGT